jgi:hypothetical protein
MSKFEEVPQIPQANDIPTSDVESIESSKLEWGPTIGSMDWRDTQIYIEELNRNLAEGEKPWRLPTKDELVEESKNFISVGLYSNYYWSGTVTPRHEHMLYTVDMRNGKVSGTLMVTQTPDLNGDESNMVRLVRDVA